MKTTSVFAFLFMLTIFGCKSSTPTAVQVPTGELRGTVILIDGYGDTLAQKAGVVVNPIGTTLSATTDANGDWVIKNVPAQTYSVSYTKTGFGARPSDSVTIKGDDTVTIKKPGVLYEALTCTVFLDSVSVTYRQEPHYFGFQTGHISNISLADSSKLQVIVLFGYSRNIVYGDRSTYLGGSLFTNPSRSGNPLTKQGDNLRFSYDYWEGCCAPETWPQHEQIVYLQAFVLPKKNLPFYTDSLTNTYKNIVPIPKSKVYSVFIP